MVKLSRFIYIRYIDWISNFITQLYYYKLYKKNSITIFLKLTTIIFRDIKYCVFVFLGHDLQKTVFQNNQSPNAPLIHEESTIKILRLGFNNIHSLSPNCFEYLTRLEVLELNNNPLSVIDQNTEITLGYLINLQVFSLYSIFFSNQT